MKTLIMVAHNLKSNTLEAVWFGADGHRGCQNFHPLQIDDFKLAAGEHAQKYIDLAGWTPEYIASVKKKEEDEAKRKQEEADAEAAEAKSKQEQADKEAFDAEVARQVAIMEAAQVILSKQTR